MISKGVKRLVTTMCTLATVVSLVGCGSKTTADTKKVTEEKKVELSLLDFLIPAEGASKALDPLYQKYLADHPNVTIDREAIASKDLQVKVQTLSAANELPDIFMIKGQMAESFVKNGKVYAVDDILNSNKEWKDNFKEGVFSNFTIGGKTYGIPFQVTNTAAFYNKEIFKKAGIEKFPSTWAELMTAVEKLKAINVVPIALGNKDKANAESFILSTLGNRFTGDKWYQSIRDKSGAKFTDPEFVSGLTALSDLAKAGAFNTSVNSIDDPQQRQMYMTGKAAMTFTGTWAINDLQDNCPKEILDVTEIGAMPSVDGGKGDAMAITGGAGWSYCINANIAPEKIKAATEYLVAVTGAEFATGVKKQGGMTAAKPGSDEKNESKILYNKFIEFTKDRPFIPVYDHQLNSSLIEVMTSGLQEMLIGTVTPKELAARIQKEYEKK